MSEDKLNYPSSWQFGALGRVAQESGADVILSRIREEQIVAAHDAAEEVFKKPVQQAIRASIEAGDDVDEAVVEAALALYYARRLAQYATDLQDALLGSLAVHDSETADAIRDILFKHDPLGVGGGQIAN